MFGKSKTADPFIVALGRHAETIVTAATAFVELFDDVARSEQWAKRIKDAEAAADSITHDTIARLHKQWITPFDRGDIHGLMTALDDVIDTIHSAAMHIKVYRIDSCPDAAKELARVLERSTRAVNQGVAQLTDLSESQRVLDRCEEVVELEGQADSLYRAAMAELFEPGADPLFIMKWRDIYGRIENAIDRCEDVANILEGVVLEYS